MEQNFLYQFIVNLNIVGQLLFSCLIFYIPLRRKRLFVLRLLLALALGFGIMMLSVLLRTRFPILPTRFAMRLLQFTIPLVIAALCYTNGIYTKLKLWCAGIASMEIGAALYSFLLAVLGIDERVVPSFFGHSSMLASDWVLYFILHIAIYAAIFLLFGQKSAEELDRNSRGSTVLLALACLLFLTVPDCISNEYRDVSYPLFLVNRLYLLALAGFILAICTSIEFQSRYRMDMEVMDQVLSEERKQYQQMKENMDVINMRCHDLKHQLDDFSGKLTEQEIESLRDAMDFYDRNIKTGCEVLDIVLHITQMNCKNDGVELTCLANGKILNFIRTRHLYSLFNNAIGNAIEAVKKLNNPEKRVVGITVEEVQGTAVIEVTNYFDGKPITSTAKADKSHHGFGTMSMKYIAKTYGGQVQVQTTGDLYTLQIRIPLPKTV